MSKLPADLQARRAIEDRAAQLGAERNALSAKLAANSQSIIQLLRDAEGTGVTYDYLAQLTGVSRQTLYRWREVAGKFAPGESASEALSKRTQDGHLVHFKG